MGLSDVFQSVRDWVAEKSNAFLHGEVNYQNNYYGSSEEAEEYATLNEEPAAPAAPQQEGYYQAPYNQAPQAAQWQQGGYPGYGQAGGYQAAPQQPWQQAPYQQPLKQEAQPLQGGYAQRPQPKAQDNVVPFPGTFQAPSGKAYSHIERVAQLVSRDACYAIIDFMKNGESVIVNIESIQSDQEVQHCVDLLSGAAYTLGCTITKFSTQRRAYLIAPATVQVLLDDYTQKLNTRRSAGRNPRVRSYAGPEGGYEPGQRGAYEPERSPFARPAYPPRPSYQPSQQEAYYEESRSPYEQQAPAYGQDYPQAAYGGY